MSIRFLFLIFVVVLFQSFVLGNNYHDTVHSESINIEHFNCLDSASFDLFEQYGINSSAIVCEDLYCEINDWFGVPYKYGHGTKKGVDCSRLVMQLSKAIYFDPIVGTASSIYRQCKKIEKSELQEGDLIFFKINKSYVSHVGIYLQNGKFVHASRSQGVVISDISDPYYKRHFFAAGRH